MATRNFVPRQDNDGHIGTKGESGKRWASVNTCELNSVSGNINEITSTILNATTINNESLQTKNITATKTISAESLFVSNGIETSYVQLKNNDQVLNLTIANLQSMIDNATNGKDDNGNIISTTYATILESHNPNSSVIPNVHNSFDLGSSVKNWNNLYVNYGKITNLDVSGSIVATNATATNITANKIKVDTDATVLGTLIVNDIQSSSQIQATSLKLVDGHGEELIIDVNTVLGNNSSDSNLDEQIYAKKADLRCPKESLIPDITKTIDIGSSEKYWNKGYIDTLTTTNLVTTNFSASILNAPTGIFSETLTAQNITVQASITSPTIKADNMTNTNGVPCLMIVQQENGNYAFI